MGFKPASFFHEVTLFKKGLKKRKNMSFGLLQKKLAVVISNRTITFWFYWI